MESTLAPICAAWMKKIRAAAEVKKKLFGDDAEEAMKFFNGPYDFLYDRTKNQSNTGLLNDGTDFPAPPFRMSCNRVAEMVQLFGPALYHRNPTRLVTPREYPMLPPEFFGNIAEPAVSMVYETVRQANELAKSKDTARATLLDSYLNFTPYELGLKDHFRLAIDETIIKGAGCLWSETYQVPMSGWKMAGSFQDSVDNLLLDPDGVDLDHCQWIARRCCHPVWMVEREYGLPPGSLHAGRTSWNASQDRNEEPRFWAGKGETADLIVYWKIYSKMGVGARLSGVPQELRTVLDAYGDYCYLVVAENTRFPLNLPDQITETAPDDEILRRLSWPTPFWKDGTWPMTMIQFHPVSGQAWPMSHVKPGMGELKFLNWAYSFLASHIQVASRTFLAIAKSLDEDTKKAITHGPHFSTIEVEAMHQEINKAVQFLEHPPVNKDLFSIIEAVSNQFDKRVGLSELRYGETATQLRSASEAEIKSDQLRIRPEDMQSRVEEAATEIAAKEAAVARHHLRGADVAPIIGPVASYFWDQLVANATPDEITRQLQYRIEAGTTRKPNRDRQAANMTAAMNNLFNPLMQYAAQTGNVNPANALIEDWAKSQDFDAKRYLLTAPPPPPPIPSSSTPNSKPKTEKPVSVNGR